MVNLIGTYECKVDAKGRLMVPAPMKKLMAPSLQEGFVLKRSLFQKCLELYPMDKWNKEMARMEKLNPYKAKHNEFIRKFTAGVKYVEVDTNGRLLIPKDLLSYAQIDKDIVLASGIRFIEIWDKEKYEKAIETPEDEFADLAEEVMGNLGDDGIS